MGIRDIHIFSYILFLLWFCEQLAETLVVIKLTISSWRQGISTFTGSCPMPANWLVGEIPRDNPTQLTVKLVKPEVT